MLRRAKVAPAAHRESLAVPMRAGMPRAAHPWPAIAAGTARWWGGPSAAATTTAITTIEA